MRMEHLKILERLQVPIFPIKTIKKFHVPLQISQCAKQVQFFNLNTIWFGFQYSGKTLILSGNFSTELEANYDSR